MSSSIVVGGRAQLAEDACLLLRRAFWDHGWPLIEPSVHLAGYALLRARALTTRKAGDDVS